MIRQAISCDICGAEKKQTNHWFVACEVAGELRVSGWTSRNRLRAGSKHLCGQACLHKLADDFMARVIGEKSGARTQVDVEEEAERPSMDASLTSPAAFSEPESSVRVITPPEPQPQVPRPALRPELVVKPEASFASVPVVLREEPSRFTAPNRRAEAWERERERAARATGSQTEVVARRLVN